MTITVEAKEQYGTTRYYPTDPEIAEAYTRLTGRKTVLIEDSVPLKTLGIEIVTVAGRIPFDVVHPSNPFSN